MLMWRVNFETVGGYIIACPQQKIISLGRRDKANEQQIDIDFASLGEHGVSRLHALVYNTYHGIYIEDFNSRNGTFINEYALLPMRRYSLNHHDKLKIGRIEVIVHITQHKELP